MNDALQTVLVLAFIAALILTRASSWPGLEQAAMSIGTAAAVHIWLRKE